MWVKTLLTWYNVLHFTLYNFVATPRQPVTETSIGRCNKRQRLGCVRISLVSGEASHHGTDEVSGTRDLCYLEHHHGSSFRELCDCEVGLRTPQIPLRKGAGEDNRCGKRCSSLTALRFYDSLFSSLITYSPLL